MMIRLTDEQEQLIEQQLATGRFTNKSEVISEALTLLGQQDEVDIELRSMFARAHERNTDLDVEKTIDLIEEVVKEDRRGHNP